MPYVSHDFDTPSCPHNQCAYGSKWKVRIWLPEASCRNAVLRDDETYCTGQKS